MSATPTYRAGAVGGRGGLPPSTRALSIGESAWLALLPCAALLLLVLVAAGPPLGRLLLAPTGAHRFWPHDLAANIVRPEPTEHARFMLALLGPFLLAGGALALAGRGLRPTATKILTAVAQAALIAFVLGCVAYQHQLTYDASYFGQPGLRAAYFSSRTLVVALLLALGAAGALSHPPSRARLTRLARETPGKRIAALVVAILFLAAWSLAGFNTDGSLATVNESLIDNTPLWIDESFAILNGQAPLVDFHVQYGQLWAYLGAAALAAFGTSWGVYAAAMLAGTAASLLAVFAALRTVARTSLAALALFLPFVATGYFMEAGPPENRYGPTNLFSIFPIRYAGPYVLFWLVVRRVERGARAPPVALFAFAGLVAINNLEFGVPACGAALVALLLTQAGRSVDAALRILTAALAGLALAVAIVVLLTLAVVGALPDFRFLTTFPQIYWTEGYGLFPTTTIGLYLVLYVTHAAAVVVAIVRRDEERPALTGALAWSGVFGLGAGIYFMGRSHPHVLVSMFSPWALSLGLLLVSAVRASGRRASPRPTAAELLVLLGFAISVCSLAQTPTPWSQLRRLRDAPPSSTPTLGLNLARHAIAGLTQPGQTVAILVKSGHRIADQLGLVDVAPYANIETTITRGQWEDTVAALAAAGGNTLIVPRDRLLPEHVHWLERVGYVAGREDPAVGVIAFVRRR